jgi:hypothetical protein
MCKVRRNFQERAVSSVVEHLVYTNALTNTLICSRSFYRVKTREQRVSHIIRNALKKLHQCKKTV